LGIVPATSLKACSACPNRPTRVQRNMGSRGSMTLSQSSGPSDGRIVTRTPRFFYEFNNRDNDRVQQRRKGVAIALSTSCRDAAHCALCRPVIPRFLKNLARAARCSQVLQGPRWRASDDDGPVVSQGNEKDGLAALRECGRMLDVSSSCSVVPGAFTRAQNDH